MRFRSSNAGWGILLLLIAAFVLLNQFTDFTHIGIGSLIAVAIAVVMIVQCIARMNFAPLPIPLAALYFVFQVPLGLPFVRLGILIAVAVLSYLGLDMLLPGKRWRRRHEFKFDSSEAREQSSAGNTPSFSVNFGSAKHRLRADALQTAHLNCSFGAMEVVFDEVELAAGGAEVVVGCNFGAIKLRIPRHWRIMDQVSCSLGGVDIGKCFSDAAENAPRLTISGGVSFGGIEVRHL